MPWNDVSLALDSDCSWTVKIELFPCYGIQWVLNTGWWYNVEINGQKCRARWRTKIWCAKDDSEEKIQDVPLVPVCAEKLLILWGSKCRVHPVACWHCVLMFFLCEKIKQGVCLFRGCRLLSWLFQAFSVVLSGKMSLDFLLIKKGPCRQPIFLQMLMKEMVLWIWLWLKTTGFSLSSAGNFVMQIFLFKKDKGISSCSLWLFPCFSGLG